jgi:hypothetical protein
MGGRGHSGAKQFVAHDFDAYPEQRAQLFTHPSDPKQRIAVGSIKVDQNVDIAAWAGITPRHRTEQAGV